MPVFKGKGNKGNFEPATYGGGSGPGEDGKAHKLRVEQRDEEERLKGVYGFNQLVSDEIRQDNCCLQKTLFVSTIEIESLFETNLLFLDSYSWAIFFKKIIPCF